MKNKNEYYGGFIVSQNVINGVQIRYSYREKSSIPQLNGWNILSKIDDEDYISEPGNFSIISAEAMLKLAPVFLEIFDAPYGTDLFWKYEEDVHIGFYDLIGDCETNIERILNK